MDWKCAVTMLKFLYPEIPWGEVEIVGFDMDGTLYDEVEFISQVYRPIALKLSVISNKCSEEIYEWMKSRWVEKGSSYNKIFEEVLYGVNINNTCKEKIISECVTIFRDFKPQITLSEKVKVILNEMSKNFKLFLVSDGSKDLQARKFKSLDLGRWIEPANIGITGEFGPHFYKPSTKIIEKIQILKPGNYEGKVVYFGDRDVDKYFSSRAKFKFVHVNCMKVIA